MPFTISDTEKPELLCTFASLILFDDKIAITADKISALITASGNNVEPYWPKLFSDFLSKKNNFLDDLISGNMMAAPAQGSAPVAKEEKKEEAKKEEKKQEVKEESEQEVGFDLFGDDE